MKTVDISDQATADLDAIWLYIAEDNVEAAERVNAEILNIARDLAVMPGMGRSCPELGEGVRSFPHGNYLIFYRETLAGILLLRVIHGARRLRAL